MASLVDLSLVGVACAHVLLAPYSKVEESFSLHATHDALLYGVRPSSLLNYDHFVFPGAVPRSFVGSMLLAWSTTPVLRLSNFFGILSNKLDLQIICRLTLAVLNAISLAVLRRIVSKRFGFPTSLLFALFTCTQFHLPFWMGRTLPNMFALLPVNIAHAALLNRTPSALKPSARKVHVAIAWLTFTAVVLRAEVAGLLIPLILQALIAGWSDMRRVFKVGMIAGLGSLALTLIVDSYFWQSVPLWPELAGLYFNVYQGKSADWGVSPFHTYFTAHLPKLLLSAFPLALLGLAIDHRVRQLLLPSICFVFLISGLGHKEWRFVVYVVPPFNIAAARGARALMSLRKSAFIGRLAVLAVAGCVALNVLITVMLSRASIANYPGGEAISVFNDIYANRTNVHVHISNLAAQTGASLFTQVHAPPLHGFISPRLQDKGWVYNKTEGLTPRDLSDSKHFTHLIAESSGQDWNAVYSSRSWTLVRTIEAFDGWKLDRSAVQAIKDEKDVMGLLRLRDAISMQKADKLWILERNG
ncbi:alpha-1,6-mannosyltransferase subunit [Punctularia strigosozonata HHB-11173 SS5]|uniref:alpha-1,6-mannosyltransferase subunit n=1 Tax=Punctularia strigosozonata (strain HHB-11173) TaxID=741275 RepID=UPI0004418535|nr:alpha-1,6-mannosyltransferase subunit [Punctularia strigosozonata HHB-11173 SS5]EIN10091.1 alpha-1,6-mannosyltransferase subunit [Punctularia strigosozonata HHB-11173 SS5]